MTHPPWTIALGCASYLVVLYFWISTFLPFGWITQRPGDLFPLVIGVIVSALLSVPAAVRGAKWWYISTVLNTGTLTWVMWRFH